MPKQAVNGVILGGWYFKRVANKVTGSVKGSMNIANQYSYANGNGIIEYVTPTKSYDPSLKYRMDQITKIQGPTTITIPANGSKVVTATVTMPKQAVNGVTVSDTHLKRPTNNAM
ncbi:hypothetical protein WP50_35650 [Lactiplantibacillus plantarum]|nr:hypothetical protein WP50_35650 [Lactiplantibacillus plantarum]